MRFYERRLPHWDVTGQPLFVTFRLHGSLPKNRIFPPGALTDHGKSFAAMDRLLDNATTGPLYLRQPQIAKLVEKALLYGAFGLRRFELHAYVIMPNHVHLLVTPHVTSTRWLGPLKGLTAREADQLLNATGPFWQDESYDHLVRSGEFDRIHGYIELNPVRAGFCKEPEQFLFSSARRLKPAAVRIARPTS